MQTIEIAKILKPQGIKGELKIQCFLLDKTFFKNLKKVFIDEKEYSVLSTRVLQEPFGFIMLEGVCDRNQAEEFRNKSIFASKDEIETKNDEYFISDLENCQVVDEDENLLGFIESVEKYGAADIINIMFGGARKSFPFIKSVIKEVDVKEKKVIVFRQKLEEVLV